MTTKTFNNIIVVILTPVIKISYVLDKSLFLNPKSLFYDGNLQLWQNIVFYTEVL